MGRWFIAELDNRVCVSCKRALIGLPIEGLSLIKVKIKHKKNWAYRFRFGILGVPAEDFQPVAEAINEYTSWAYAVHQDRAETSFA